MVVPQTHKRYSMVRSKECFKCNTVKPLEEFYKHSMMADGHLNKCKECTKNDASKHRDKNLEKIRSYDRERAKQPKRIKATAEVTKMWRAEDSRRSAAHNAVARAIKSGALDRNPCERCGEVKSIAHHEDYDKPLEVMWLCQPCHKQRHKEINELLRRATWMSNK
jgi:ribosomal protein S27AE